LDDWLQTNVLVDKYGLQPHDLPLEDMVTCSKIDMTCDKRLHLLRHSRVCDLVGYHRSCPTVLSLLQQSVVYDFNNKNHWRSPCLKDVCLRQDASDYFQVSLVIPPDHEDFNLSDAIQHIEKLFYRNCKSWIIKNEI
jgi:hypothetical protein